MLLRSVALTCAMCAWIETKIKSQNAPVRNVAPRTGRVD